MESPQRHPDIERLRQESRDRIRAIEKSVKALSTPEASPWRKISQEAIGPENTVTATTIFDVMVPALKEDQSCLVTVEGLFFNNTGAARTFDLNIAHGDLVYTDTSGLLSATATHRPWRLVYRVVRSARTSGLIVGVMNIPTAVSATAGAGDLATDAISYVIGTDGEDSMEFSKPHRALMELTLSAASASLWMRAYRWVLEVQ